MRFWSMLIAGMMASPLFSQSLFLTPEIAVEGRGFPSDPQFEDQLTDVQGGLLFSGDLRWTSADRNLRFRFEPYLRLDSEDDERTYFDIREATLSWRRGDWDLLAGVAQIFWGVAESRNVVDIINQFDTLEDFDQGEKLGQPLIRISKRGGFGTLEFYYLPYFREQGFLGEEGRLRGPLLIDENAAVYERSGEEWAGDWALRFTNRYGDFDVGVHLFHGTSRDPLLRLDDVGDGLIPFYQERSQGGVDLQYTRGPWLLKAEAAWVDQSDTFISTVGGFEYTFFDIARRGLDVGIIGEYLYDDRDDRAPQTLFAEDVFVGMRITLNDVQDTEILAGAIFDVAEDGVIGSLEFQRRLGGRTLLEIEARVFDGDRDPLVTALREDDHLLVRLTRYF